MRFNTLILSAALVATCAAGCGDPDAEERPAADSLGVDTSMVSSPMDTTSLSDSLNAPVRPDTGRPATGGDTSAPTSPTSISKNPRDTAVEPVAPSGDASGDASGSPSDAGARRGASSVGTGVRRGSSTSDAEGRRSTDTGGSGTRRR
jgi:hypothetical protein